MAKAKYISSFERDVMRIGRAHGFSDAQIGRFCGRQRMTVGNHIKAMIKDGTIDDLPMGFVVDEIAEAIRAKG